MKIVKARWRQTRSVTFIVLEGLDGSGKSTQTTRVAEELGLPATAEPTGGDIGILIREELSRGDLEPETLALLFAADRVQHQTALDDAVCERYVYSSLAYQAAQGMDPEWLCEINRRARAPDVAVLIDIDPETALSRIEDGRDDHEIFEKRDVLKEARKEYLAIFRGDDPYGGLRRNHAFLDTEYRIVDGEGSVGDVTDRVLDAVRDILGDG